MARIGIVVPSIRVECLRRFLNEWKGQFERYKKSKHEVYFYLVEDNRGKSIKISQEIKKIFAKFFHLSWHEIKMDLGDDAWIIPKRTDCVRSYGYYRAYVDECDMVITMDDDCYPHNFCPDYIDMHYRRLFSDVANSRWFNTIETYKPRGYPYEIRKKTSEVKMVHGLWDRTPDLDGMTQLQVDKVAPYLPQEDKVVPFGQYYPCCGMNLSFKRDMIPFMYFMLMGRDYPNDRFGDIWAGVVTKKICDTNGWSIISGNPIILHSRASNVFANIKKEAWGLQYNEDFWKVVDRAEPKKNESMYEAIIREIESAEELNEEYFKKLGKAMRIWYKLFRG